MEKKGLPSSRRFAHFSQTSGHNTSIILRQCIMDDYPENYKFLEITNTTRKNDLRRNHIDITNEISLSAHFVHINSNANMFQINSSVPNNISYFDNYNVDSDCATEGCNDTNLNYVNDTLPPELTEMSESSRHCMIAYCVLFVIATTGNLTVLLSVFKQYKKTKSRISLLILHLSIADLFVSCTLIPTEIFWRLTIQWRGGNALCKVMQFLRAFGLYLSSMVLICVSFDRFFAILFPMKMLKRQGHQKIKIMLWIAWTASAAFSAPQVILTFLRDSTKFHRSLEPGSLLFSLLSIYTYNSSMLL